MYSKINTICNEFVPKTTLALYGFSCGVFGGGERKESHRFKCSHRLNESNSLLLSIRQM